MKDPLRVQPKANTLDPHVWAAFVHISNNPDRVNNWLICCYGLETMNDLWCMLSLTLDDHDVSCWSSGSNGRATDNNVSNFEKKSKRILIVNRGVVMTGGFRLSPVGSVGLAATYPMQARELIQFEGRVWPPERITHKFLSARVT